MWGPVHTHTQFHFQVNRLKPGVNRKYQCPHPPSKIVPVFHLLEVQEELFIIVFLLVILPDLSSV